MNKDTDKPDLVRENKELLSRCKQMEARIRELRAGQADTTLTGTDPKKAQNPVIKQSRLLETFFSSTITPLVVLDRNFNFVRVNEAYAKACGRDIADFPGLNHFDLYPSDAQAIFEEVVATRKPYGAVNRPFSFFDHPEWGVTYWNWTLTPLLDDTGEAEFLVFSLEDVTERARAQDQLRKVANIIDRAGFGMALSNAKNNTIEFVNPAYAAQHGYMPDEMVGMPFAELYAPRWKALLPEYVEKVDREGRLVFESEHIRKDGSIFPALINVTPVKDGEGKALYRVVSTEDITELKKTQETLRQNEELLRTVLETMPVGVSLTDKEGVLTYGNPATRRIWAGAPYTNAEQSGEHKAWWADTGKRIKPDEWPSVRAIRKGEASIDVEVDIESSDGTRKTILNSAVPIRNPEGKITGAIIVDQDITERKQAIGALRLANAYNRSLIEAGLDPLVTISPEGKITDVNRATELITGYAREELMGTDFSSYFTNPQEAQRGYQTVYAAGSVRDYELEIRHKEGHVTPVLYNATLFRDEKGKVIGVFAAARDISERKKSEKELLRLVKAIEQSTEAVAIVDTEFNIEYVNPAFENQYEYTRAEITGEKITVVTGDAYNEVFYTSVWDTVKQGGVWVGRLLNKSRTGRLLDVEATISPISDSSGSIINYVAIGRDISDQIKLETQLRQSQKMEAIGTLAGGIAHDFNNIIAGIIGFTEMVLDDTAPEDPAHRRLSLALKGAYRGRDLVKQILTFSRKGERELKPLSMGVAVNEALHLLRASLPSTIEIRQNIRTESGIVLGDQTQIHQILLNLCTNASYAMREQGGILEVSLEDAEFVSSDYGVHPELKPGSYLRLTVRDTGSGMTPEVMERIFDPFFTTKAAGEGTGMGLSVVHGIVRTHGGAITVRSKVNEGSAFEVFLPKMVTETTGEGGMPEQVPEGKERILCVDDEEILTEMNQQRLERLGYTVVATTSSIQALEIFRAAPHRFDLVITDHTMPRLTGLDLAKEMLDIRPDIPVILCSGHNEMVSQDKIKETGIREFFRKPMGKQEMAKLIRKILDETSVKSA